MCFIVSHDNFLSKSFHIICVSSNLIKSHFFMVKLYKMGIKTTSRRNLFY